MTQMLVILLVSVLFFCPKLSLNIYINFVAGTMIGECPKVSLKVSSGFMSTNIKT